MSNQYFQFKQFTVWHDKCAMKVGTDGVLLGAWANICNVNSVLDIGTGTGLVALMIAQRCTADIVALEIDENAAVQAAENKEKSPWKERILVHHTDFKAYTSDKKFDLIVSNPPYFSNSLLSPDQKRSTARHTNELSYQELIKGASQLLSENGEFSMIIPSDNLDNLKNIAEEYNLYIIRQTNILPKPDSASKRVLITLSFDKTICTKTDELVVELSRHQYSKDYIALTKEYYLNM
jgi:tRNA1Val (adenine37-N6)-methyltransferase